MTSSPVSAAGNTEPGGIRRQPSLAGNILALGLLQMSNYVLPLAVAAYTTRVLGIEDWGRVALAQLIIGFFSLVVSWGFSWSATRKIAAISDDAIRTSRTAFATILAQLLLAMAMSLLLVSLVATLPFFADARPLYLWGLLVIAGTALFPNWLLTGLERMREFSVIQITGRALALVFIVLFVRRPEDAPLIIAFQGSISILAGLATIWWLHRNAILIFRRPTASEVATEFKEGSAIFSSTTAISIYVNLTPVILGVLAGPVAVGQFALANRIRLAAQSVLAPVSTALFPRISRMVANDPESAMGILRISGIGIVIVSAGISAALYFFSDLFVLIIAGTEFGPAGSVLRRLSLLPFLMSFSTFLGLQVLLPNMRTRAFNRILLSAGALSLAMIVPMVEWKGAEGAAITLLVVEGFVSMAMIVYVLRTGYFRVSGDTMSSKRWFRR